MKNLNLTKVALSLIVGTQLLGTSAFAKAKVHEELLTKNKAILADRRYQVKAPIVIEISDEEAMKYINDSAGNLETKNLTLPVIPPRFPVVGGTPTPAATPSVTTPAPIVSPGASTPTPAPTGFFDGVIMVVDKLIAIGQKIIPTIEKGRPVLTYNPMAAISVLPRLDTKDPVLHDMSGWSYPVTKHYKIIYKNGFGGQSASFIYSITFQYGGSHDGKGKYLTGVRAAAREIVINMGSDLDAESQLVQISNVGTKDKVVAGATIEMSYTVKNFARRVTSYVSFFITGDGRLIRLD
jgi:hypothetical protein